METQNQSGPLNLRQKLTMLQSDIKGFNDVGFMDKAEYAQKLVANTADLIGDIIDKVEPETS